MNTKRNKIKKGDTMIYEEKRFMAVSEIEKECCTGCCFYDNGNCQLENPNCFNSGIIWVQKEDYMSEISEKAIKLAKEAFDVSTLPEGRGFWWNPVRISV